MEIYLLQIILGLILTLTSGKCAILPYQAFKTVFQPENCTIKSEVYNRLVVHYAGYLGNDKMFDSSWDRNTPLSFRLGMNEATPAWDQGLIDMCVGEKRSLMVPKQLVVARPGYEFLVSSGHNLFYYVELLEIDNSFPLKEEFFKAIDSNFDKKLSRDEIKIFVQKHLGITDTNGNTLDDNEVEARLLSERDKTIELAFERDDANGDGVIDYNEWFTPQHNEF